MIYGCLLWTKGPLTPASALHKCLLDFLTARRDYVTWLTYVVCAWVNTPRWWNTPRCVSQNVSLLLSEACLKSSWLQTCVIHDIIHVDDLIDEIARVAGLKFVRQACQLETLRQGIILKLWVIISSPERKVIFCFSLFYWLSGSHSHWQIPTFFQVVTVNLNLPLMCSTSVLGFCWVRRKEALQSCHISKQLLYSLAYSSILGG